MSDSEPDLELLELLRARFGPQTTSGPPDTKVLSSAQFIYDNSTDVALDMRSTKAAAALIHAEMQSRAYSTTTWSTQPLHPQAKDEQTVNFIFTMDLLNFSFWSTLEEADEKRFAIVYEGKRWTGYFSLVALLRRALDMEIPITSPEFWIDDEACTDEVLRAVFSSGTEGGEEIPLFEERVKCLREAGRVLHDAFDGSIVTLIDDANGSAAALVNLLAEKFDCFRDEAVFERKTVRFLKRAQIFVADLWACFDGESYGAFNDIHTITMFADYRIPQILHSLSILSYCPPLSNAIQRHQMIEPGHSWELQIRGCSIWAVELLRREIVRLDPEAKVNAILIDFFLYDLAKEREREARERGGEGVVPHHRTRSIWY
ncbi:hypothetical protein NX059_006620 [Plenodomus lindquistii]|nr:hypothetical protein NX059_006620 [Plenodomus lindquistii]